MADPPAGDFRTKASYYTYTLLGAALQRVPEPIGMAIATGVGEVLVRRSSEARRLAMGHIRRVLMSGGSGAEPDPLALRRWTRRAFRSYVRYWVEGARLPALNQDVICRRMVVEEGFDHLRQAMASGTGVVLALPHVGSWDWGGAYLAAIGYPMTSVAEVLEPPELFDWFIRQREALGLTIVPLGSESGAPVLRTLRQGGLVGLLCDRDLLGNGVEVDFFGERTTLPAGPATLALRTGATLLTAVVYSGPGKGHTGVVSSPIDTERRGPLRADVTRITQDIARHFEGYIRRAPEQWHLFQPNWPSDRPVGPDLSSPLDPPTTSANGVAAGRRRRLSDPVSGTASVGASSHHRQVR